VRHGILRVLVVACLLPLLLNGSPLARATSTRPPLGYGIVVSNTQNYPEAAKLGFGYVKLFIGWDGIEPQQGVFSSGGYPDSAVAAALSNNLKIVGLIFDTPGWANGTGVYNPNDPPPSADHVADFGVFMATLAAHYKGQIFAYEIWNEPNVSDTWGGQNPDPTRFVAMLQAAYPLVKGADPNALVVSGGLANTGAGNGGSALGDLVYLQDMLQDGALGNVDAIGIHPYPGACDPTATSCAATPGTYFQRANDEHNTEVQFGGSNPPPLWITEAGYFSVPGVIDPNAAGCNGSNGLGGFTAYEVSEANKASWAVEAYQDAYDNWPWLGMFIWMNLDLSQDTWRATCDPARFWAILTSSGIETQAYTALQQMQKLTVQLSIVPPPTTGYPEGTGTATISGNVIDGTTGQGVAIDQLTASVDSATGSSSPLATPVIGANGAFQIVVNVTTLSAYVTHLIYINAHTPADGWISGSTGVYVQPQINVAPTSVVALVDPKQGSGNIALALGRNDGNSSPYAWNYSVSYGPGASNWLVGPTSTGGPLFAGQAKTAGLPNGTYTATITISSPAQGTTPGSLYFADQLTIPITLIVGPVYQIAIPGVSG
jgi:hypothetical protein